MTNPCFHAKPLHLELYVYQEKENTDQLEFVAFHLEFGDELNPRNRWVRLSRLIPWEEFEPEYAKHFPSKTGNLAKPFRMALGALLIKADIAGTQLYKVNITLDHDREVEEISCNCPYN